MPHLLSASGEDLSIARLNAGAGEGGERKLYRGEGKGKERN